ncbi:MAG: hypothetical protein ACK40G_02345 [Cytophagaceae bacterium]
MRNITNSVKNLLVNVSTVVTVCLSFYFSSILFIILLLDQAIYGKLNVELKEDFEHIIDRIEQMPVSLRSFLFPDEAKNSVDVIKEA